MHGVSTVSVTSRSAFCHRRHTFNILQLHHPTDPDTLLLRPSLRDQPRHKFLQVLFESSSAFVRACGCVSLSLVEIMRTEKSATKCPTYSAASDPMGGRCMQYACYLHIRKACLETMHVRNAGCVKCMFNMYAVLACCNTICIDVQFLVGGGHRGPKKSVANKDTPWVPV